MDKIDESLFLAFNKSGSKAWDLFWVILTDKYLAALIFGFILLFLWWKYSFKTVFIIGLFMIALVGVTDGLSTGVKNVVKRHRPCSVHSPISVQVRVVSDGLFSDLTTKNEEKCEKYSFFSSHAAVSFALALFFGLLLNRWFKYSLLLLTVWGVLVGSSRIYLGFHYPSDIIVGAMVGVLVGVSAYRGLIFFQSKLNYSL